MKVKKALAISLILVIFLSCIIYVWYNYALEKRLSESYSDLISEYAFKHEIDANLVHAVIKAESKYNKDAVSASGAIGLMQILPNTGKYIADMLGENFSVENLKSPDCNIRYGTWYLQYLFKKFENQNTVIAAYNAGEGNVFDWLKIYSKDGKNLDTIPFKETRLYVDKVNKFYLSYKSRYNY